jgi:hypothetical protein
VTGLSCHHRLADHPAKLDASVGASGPHDFTVRKQSALVRSAVRVHRIPPAFVTIAKRPFAGTGQKRNNPASTRPSSQISENQKLSCRHRRGVVHRLTRR